MKLHTFTYVSIVNTRTTFDKMSKRSAELIAKVSSYITPNVSSLAVTNTL